MANLGATELLIIAAVVLLLFGGKKLPEMARSLGRSAKILKAETSGSRDTEAPAAPEADDPRVTRLQQQVDDLQRQLRAAQQAPKTTP